MSTDETARELIAPTGTLRAAINTGNAVLAQRPDPAGEPTGISVAIARELAAMLGADLRFEVVTSAKQSVAAVAEGRADLGFFAIDPTRAEQITFTEPYLHIEGWYAVRDDSPLTATSEVDAPGVRVAVSDGSAYDLHLTRTLQQAEIVRAPNPQSVVPLFLERDLEVAAGVREQLELDLAANPGLRLLPDRFMGIPQALGMARPRPDAAHAALASCLAELTCHGRLEAILREHGQSATA